MENEKNIKDLQKALNPGTNIYQKLLVIQSEVNGLAKDKKSFGFSYVSGDKLLSFIKPIMVKQGLILKQEILSIDNVRQDYFTGKTTERKEKNEILTKVMMRFTWVDTDTGEQDVNMFGANGQNGWDKGVGSALTYAERYFLLKYFHISTDQDDIDQPAPEPVKPTEPVKVKLTDEQVERMCKTQKDDFLKESLNTYNLTDLQIKSINTKLGIK
jgi:hypothetical protein